MAGASRYWLTVALGVAGSAAWTQVVDLPPVAYPALPAVANAATGFVSPGWQLVTRDQGDLDGDGRADLALLLKMADPANILTVGSAGGREPVDTNPYRLVIALARRQGGYRLADENRGLIPRRTRLHDGEDPIGEETVTIERGTLLVRFGHLRGSTSYRFRWHGSAMRLIGYDQSGVSGGCIGVTSINHLTRRARLERIWQEEDRGVVRWRAVRPGRIDLHSIDRDGFDPEAAILGDIPYCRPRDD